MSFHYDMVLVCDLREDTPEPCIDLIRWLSDPASDPETRPEFDCVDENGKDLADRFDDPFLASNSNEEVISDFQKRYRYTSIKTGNRVYRYRLQFSAREILDDGFYECHLQFVDWLASIAEEGFIGYYRELSDDKPALLYVKDRKLVIER